MFVKVGQIVIPVFASEEKSGRTVLKSRALFLLVLFAIAATTAALVVHRRSVRQSRALERIERLGAALSRRSTYDVPYIEDTFGALVGERLSVIWQPADRGGGDVVGKIVDACAEISNLEAVKLSAPWLTDQDVAPVFRLKSLQYLDLSRTAITDDTLHRMRELPNLIHIRINGVPLTGSGFEHWPASSPIQDIEIEDSEFSDEALSYVSRFTNLSYLSVAGKHLTDAGCVELARSKSLEVIKLFSLTISDSGLNSLMQVRSLQSVYLTGEKVTCENVKRLRASRPEMSIHSSDCW